MNIAYGELKSPIGLVQIGVVIGAVVALKFEGGRRLIEDVIARRFGDLPQGADRALDDVLGRLDSYFRGCVDALESIEVGARGTPFQVSVWRQLTRIPAGAAVSYSDIACAIGKPAAVRAVGSANGQNPIGIIIRVTA